MSTRFNEINEKDVDVFNETEENQNTKRKTELISQVKLEAMSIDRREWKNCRRLNSIHI